MDNVLRLDRLPWIDVSPYDQVLTDLVGLCQSKEIGLICIQGSNGAGKSRILTELLSTLSFDARASLIALNGMDNEVFYHNVQLSSELLDFKHSEFLHNFTLTLEAILNHTQHFYILIDDVEKMSHELLQGMIKIITQNSVFSKQVTLVVFMGVAPINLETRRLLSDAKIITLSPMSIIESKQFVDRVYQYLKLEKEVSITEITQLHGMSYGYIGRLIKLLEENEAKKYDPVSRSYQWIFGLIGLVIVGSAILFFIKPNHPMLDETPEGPILEVPEVIRVEPIEVRIIKEEPKVIRVLESVPVKVVQPVEIEDIEIKEKEVSIHNYVIELNRHVNRQALESSLKGRMIPGTPQYKQINQGDGKIWVVYIGPYSSERNAMEGKSKLPASLQRLPLKVKKEF